MGTHINCSCGSYSPQTRTALDAIRRIVQSLRVASRDAERRFGLTAAQLFVLQKLAESDAASLNELAARTATHQSSVSVVVDRLVKRGFISRSASSEDARRIVLSLTARGARVVRSAPEAAQERLIAAIESLSEPRRKTLATLLERVAVGAAADAAPPPLFFEDQRSRRNRSNVAARR